MVGRRNGKFHSFTYYYWNRFLCVYSICIIFFSLAVKRFVSLCLSVWLQTAINNVPPLCVEERVQFRWITDANDWLACAISSSNSSRWPLTHTRLALTIPRPRPLDGLPTLTMSRRVLHQQIWSRHATQFFLWWKNNKKKDQFSFFLFLFLKKEEERKGLCRWRNWKRWVMTSDPLRVHATVFWMRSVKLNHWNHHPFRRGRVNPADARAGRKPSIECPFRPFLRH